MPDEFCIPQKTVSLHKETEQSELFLNVADAAHLTEISLRDVLKGRIHLVRGALQFYGLLDAITETISDVVARVVSVQAARDLSKRGIEQLHSILDTQQVSAIRSTLDTEVEKITAQVVDAFIAGLPRQEAPIYSCKFATTRMMMPENVISTHRTELGSAKGYLVPHDAHRDSWCCVANNSINLWVAVGRVRKGNGLMIFPEVLGRKLKRRDLSVDADEPLGTPINFDMNPGDMLVFSANQVHATERNLTDETRCVISARISLGVPRYSLGTPHWLPYDDKRLLKTLLKPLAPVASRISYGLTRLAGRVFLPRGTQKKL